MWCVCGNMSTGVTLRSVPPGLDEFGGVRRERGGVARDVDDPLGRGVDDPVHDLLREPGARRVDDEHVGAPGALEQLGQREARVAGEEAGLGDLVARARRRSRRRRPARSARSPTARRRAGRASARSSRSRSRGRRRAPSPRAPRTRRRARTAARPSRCSSGRRPRRRSAGRARRGARAASPRPRRARSRRPRSSRRGCPSATTARRRGSRRARWLSAAASEPASSSPSLVTMRTCSWPVRRPSRTTRLRRRARPSGAGPMRSSRRCPPRRPAGPAPERRPRSHAVSLCAAPAERELAREVAALGGEQAVVHREHPVAPGGRVKAADELARRRRRRRRSTRACCGSATARRPGRSPAARSPRAGRSASSASPTCSCLISQLALVGQHLPGHAGVVGDGRDPLGARLEHLDRARVRVAALALVHDARARGRRGPRRRRTPRSRRRRSARRPRRRTRATRCSARARPPAVGAEPSPPVPADRSGASVAADPRALSRVRGGARDEQLEQRLLRVAAVLGLVPDALARAVEDLGGDLLARRARAGRAARTRRARRRRAARRRRGRRRARARRCCGGLLVAHADPDVGVDGAGAGDGLARVARAGLACPSRRRAARGRPRARSPPARRRPRRGRRACRGWRASARRCCRRRRRPGAGRASESCASRSVSRSASAWQGWWLGGEHVDHRDRAVLGELLEHLVRPGAHADGGDVAREHERRVAHRLAARELQLVGAQHDGVAAELVHADVEREPRARGGLLEDERHAAPCERARAERVGLQLERAVEQRVELARRELGAGEEVLRHGRASLG